MFVICNEKEAGKKQLKKAHKILISSHLEDVQETKLVTHLTQLTPSISLFNAFIDGDVGRKKYVKKYISTIENDDELMSSLIMLIMAHQESTKGDKEVMALVASSDELGFDYLQSLGMYIEEMFGVPVVDYKEWKAHDFRTKKTKLSDIFNKLVKKYRHILFGDYNEYEKAKKFISGNDKSSKKKNKKKKVNNKKSNKDTLNNKAEEFSKKCKKEIEFDFTRSMCKTHVLKIKRKKKW